jgi:hypothetical protein
VRITKFPLAIASPCQVKYLVWDSATNESKVVTRTFESKTEAFRFMDRMDKPCSFEEVSV